MTLPIKKINLIMNKVDELVKIESFEEAYIEYKMINSKIETMQYIVSETNKFERDIVAGFYSSYAYFLFSFSEYKKFLEMYIKAQRYGYSFKRRREFIYEAFVKPNLSDFKLNYDINIKNMMAQESISKVVEFDELPYWLVTTGNKNEYYLYEKQTDMIKNKFVLDIDDTKLPKIDITTSSADFLIVNNGSWPEVQSYVKENNYQRKKSYVTLKDSGKLFSYLQGGIISEQYFEDLVIFEGVNDFKRYFVNSNHYLPRNIIGTEAERAEYTNMIKVIKNHRLSKKEKPSDNVLLSICIPSYNRGKRAYDNIIHTLKSEFDMEIEIVLSNNGTKNDSEKYYQDIKGIKDPRVTYYEFEQNQGFALNLCKVVDLARGKYVLLLSDEDLIDLNELKYVISILDSHKDDISVVRTKSDRQGLVPFIGMSRLGEDSLLKFMLTSNYMSGVIFNKELLEKEHLTSYIKRNLQNEACFYYPHMIWELVLCQAGNVLGLDVILINEGEAEKTDVITVEIDEAKEKAIPYYATLRGRLGQHRGFYNVIKELEISKKDFDIFRKLYRQLYMKTFYLINLSIHVYYKGTSVNISELLDVAYEELEKDIEDMYRGKKNYNKYKYVEDMKEIKECYMNCKARC